MIRVLKKIAKTLRRKSSGKSVKCRLEESIQEEKEGLTLKASSFFL
jgi:hypothetical protein